MKFLLSILAIQILAVSAVEIHSNESVSSFGLTCLGQTNCKSNLCYDNQTCRLGCEGSWWGSKCDKPCGWNCTICDQTTGVCRCKDGFYGPSCTLNCPSNCGYSCSQNGDCTNGCKASFWGAKCDKKCGIACANKVCDQTSGRCSSCINGFHGDKCSSYCPSYCLTLTCSQNEGKCTRGCQGSHWGSTCQHVCRNCQNNVCSQTNGHCSSCKNGFYGPNCVSNCPSNCINSTCSQSNGQCTIGCKCNPWGTSFAADDETMISNEKNRPSKATYGTNAMLSAIITLSVFLLLSITVGVYFFIKWKKLNTSISVSSQGTVELQEHASQEQQELRRNDNTEVNEQNDPSQEASNLYLH